MKIGAVVCLVGASLLTVGLHVGSWLDRSSNLWKTQRRHLTDGEEDPLLSCLPGYTRTTIDTDSSSPQYRAYEKLLADVENIIDLPDWRKRQLFALTAIYFAMDGESWSKRRYGNWLNFSIPECEWEAPDVCCYDIPSYSSYGDFVQNYPREYYEACNEWREFTWITIHYFGQVANSDTSGLHIPPEVELLPALTSLQISLNRVTNVSLSDLMPLELYRLSNMTIFSIEQPGSAFVAPAAAEAPANSMLPTEIGLWQKLQRLQLGGLSMTTLPTEIGLLKELEVLRLVGALSGPVVTEIGQMSALKVLESWGLSGLGFTGPIPSQVALLTDLRILHLASHQLNSTIPTQLGLLDSLVELRLSNNFLYGFIPTELTQLSALERLEASRNHLTGSIPGGLGRMTNLTRILLDKNKLSQSIPTQMGILSDRCEWLDLSHNSLTGEIPSELGTLACSTLALRDNRLTGTIPLQLLLGNTTGHHRIWGRRLDLSANLLTGTLPTIIGLQELELHHNYLSGTIPSQLGMSHQMAVLLLGSNSLTGFIPTQLSKLTGLNGLDLSNLFLEGSIPTELGVLSPPNGRMGYFNVSGNLDLSGVVPESLCFLQNETCKGGFWYSTSTLFVGPECVLDFDCLAGVQCGCDCGCSPNVTVSRSGLP